MNDKEFAQWDAIYDLRDEYAKDNPDLKKFKRFKTFKDEESQVRCTKCGATENIGCCPECKEEKAFLKNKP